MIRTNTINKKASLISGGYAKRMVEREKQQQKKQLIAMLKAEKDVEREKERERRAQRQKQREANTLKSAQVQVVRLHLSTLLLASLKPLALGLLAVRF